MQAKYLRRNLTAILTDRKTIVLIFIRSAVFARLPHSLQVISLFAGIAISKNGKSISLGKYLKEVFANGSDEGGGGMFLFPYKRVEKGSRIALYGAGKVGQDFFIQILQSKYCVLSVWIDKNFQAYREKYLPVYPCECLRYVVFDYVLVCVKDRQVAYDMINYLIGVGIDKAKVIWECKLEYASLWRAQELYQMGLSAEQLWKNKETEKNRRIFWLVNTPTHGNIGDFAIEMAEIQFFKELYPNDRLYTISSKMIEQDFPLLEERIAPKDIIFVTGGGFMGTLWKEEDDRIQLLIRKMERNKFVFLPQTFYYEESMEEKIKSDSKFYRSKGNLLFFHREWNSYRFFAEHIVENFGNMFCVPDMALYLKASSVKKREGVLVCLRKDQESLISEQERQFIYNALSKGGMLYKKTDMAYPVEIEMDKLEGFLEYKLNEFLSSEVVITDRLHGMIFSYITGTPCIVLPQISYKCKGVYQWVKECGNIVFEDDIHNLLIDIKRLKNLNTRNEIDLNCYFQKIKLEIDRFIEK